ncbi:MAG: hypothetical protein BWK75_06200 [Candidatus Altiarchaeales archaeon A3]|nr:MAG: hypothetical protein BWK75_06200 [Candidatus Altiarchaeales archaeon A3]
METVTLDKVYILLQKMEYRLKTIEIEMQELIECPELRMEFIGKMKKRSNEPTVKIGTLENFRKKYKLD